MILHRNINWLQVAFDQNLDLLLSIPFDRRARVPFDFREAAWLHNDGKKGEKQKDGEKQKPNKERE